MSASKKPPFSERVTPLILAIEPDSDQASAVRRAVRSLATVDLVLVESTQAALTALAESVPELILLSALLGPGDEAALAAHVRGREDASHVEMITIPMLDGPPRREEKRRGLLGVFKRGKAKDAVQGRVSPRQFANEIKAHLERTREAKADIELNRKSDPKPESGIDIDAAEPTVQQAETAPADFIAPVEVWTSFPDPIASVEAETALADPVVRIERGRVAPGRMILASDRVPGLRLSELLARAAEGSVVADLPAALFVMRRLFSAFGSVHSAPGVARTAVTLEHVVITPRAEVLGVAPAFSGFAAAPSADNRRADIAGIATIGMSMILGRRVDGSDELTRSDLLAEVADVGAIRAGDAFSTLLRSWFDRALATDAGASFLDAADAAAALERVERSGCVASRPALKAFLKNLSLADFDTREAAEIEAARIRSERARQIARRWPMPAALEAVALDPLDPPYHPAGELADVIDAVAPSTVDPATAIEIAAQSHHESAPGRAVEAGHAEFVIDESPAPWTPDLPEENAPVTVESSTPIWAERIEPEYVADRHSLESVVAEEAAPPRDEDPVQEPQPASIFASRTMLGLETHAVADEPIEITSQVEAVEEVQRPAEDESSGRGKSLRSLFRSFRGRRTDDSHAEPAHLSIAPRDSVAQEPFETPQAPAAPIEAFDLDALRAQLDESVSQTAAADVVAEIPAPWIPELPEDIAPVTVDAPTVAWADPIEYVADQPDVEVAAAAEAAAPPHDEDAEEALKAAIFASRSTLGLETHADVAAPIAPEPPSEPVEESHHPAEDESLGRGAVLRSLFRSFRRRADDSQTEPAHLSIAPHETVAQEPLDTPEPLTAPVQRFDLEALRARLDESVSPRAAATDVVAETPEPWTPEPPEDIAPVTVDAPATMWADPIEPPQVANPAVMEIAGASDEIEAVQPSGKDEPSAEPGRGASLLSLFRSFRGRGADETPAQPAHLNIAPDDTAAQEPFETAPPLTTPIEPPDLTAFHARPDEDVVAPAATEIVAETPAQWMSELPEEIAPAAADSPAAMWADPIEPQQAADPIMEIAAAAEEAAWLRDEEVVPEPVRTAISPPQPTFGLETRAEPSDDWRQPPADEILAPAQAADVAEPEAPWWPQPAEEIVAETPESSAWARPIEPQAVAELPNMEVAAAAERHVTEAVTPPPVRVAPPIAVMPERTKPEAPIKGPVTRYQAPVDKRRWTRAAAAILMAAVLVTGGRAYYFRSTTPATLRVESTPKGSEVFVDGTRKGSTPLTLQVPSGPHVLELRRNGVTRQFAFDAGAGAEISRRVDWTNVKQTGSLAITSTPAGANVVVDGKKRGVTPMTISDLSTGLHTVLLDGKEGSVRRTVTIKGGVEATLDETIFSGWIAVFAPFELKISEGKHFLGTTDSARIIVPAGRHELVLTNASLGYRETRVLDVNPGQTTSVTIEAVDGIVRVNAPPGTEVSIDGQRAGVTPLGDLHAAIGSREIVFKHPQFGQQRVVIDVKHSTPVEVTADFTRR